MDEYNLEATEYRCETCVHFPPSSTDGKPCGMCDPDSPMLNAHQKRAADPELTYYEPDDYIRRGDALREVCRMQCNDTPEHCELIGGDAREIASGKIITAYDVFEAVIEAVTDSAGALSVKIVPDENVLLSIETDSEIITDSIQIHHPQLKLTSYTEDDIQHITLSEGGAADG